MSVIYHEHRNKPADVLTPSPALPHTGGGIARSFSPLGETGKGVINIKRKHLILNT
jgi:hypothetical protein